jgi:hypothetical protein
MPLRASVLETVQLAKETTAGTLVAASKRIQSFDLDADPQIPIHMVHPQGWLAPTESVQEKEWTKAALKGEACFNTLAYLLSSLLVQGVISTPSYNGTFTVTKGTATGGTFTLTFNGQTTAAIAFGATAAAVKAALELLSTIGTGNVAVSGANGGPWTVTFQAALERTALQLTASGTSLTGPDSPYTVTPTSTAASAARRHTFVPNMQAANVGDSFTIEKGQSTNGMRFTYAIVTALDIELALKACSIKGEIIGQETTDAITMTATPTDIPVQPASPNSIDVYIGNTVLGMTKLTQAYKAMWGVKDRRKPVFTLDSAEPSYTSVVEAAFQQNASFVIEEDATIAAGLMTDLRARTTKYVRFVVTGVSIETGYTYRLQITFPCRLINPKRQDMEGVYTGAFEFEPIVVTSFPSASANGAVEVILDCAVTAL